MAKTRLYIVRHGKTMFNTIGRAQGWSDTPLTAVGERGIRELGIGLRESGLQFAKAFSSDSGRTIQTMGIMLEELGLTGRIPYRTDKPFAVNVMLMLKNVEELVNVIIEEKVPVVTTGAGTPKFILPALKEAGIKVIPVIASVKHAKKMQELGVDAVIAEGAEAGGHIGSTNTMALLPQIVDAVDIPVIGAGGIADGRGLAAAFVLGTQGVQLGTVFLASEECPIAESYKEAVLKAARL